VRVQASRPGRRRAGSTRRCRRSSSAAQARRSHAPSLRRSIAALRISRRCRA
jgi:hypothetical protein